MSENKMNGLSIRIVGRTKNERAIKLFAEADEIGIVYGCYPESGDIAAAIVAAVNNTFGAGINPEAVPDLLKALDNLHDWCVQFTPEYPAALVHAKASIEKSKIPTT